LAILGAVSRHFKSNNGEVWHEGVDLVLSPYAYFVKVTQDSAHGLPALQCLLGDAY